MLRPTKPLGDEARDHNDERAPAPRSRQPTASISALSRSSLLTGLTLAVLMVGCGASHPRHHPAVAAVHRAVVVPKAKQVVAARVDVASDAVVVKGQASAAAGAPSDAEVAREIEEAQKAGIQLPSGNTTSSFLASIANANVSAAEAHAAGASIPLATWNRLRKPIADWIVAVLAWASQHGWTGYVTSGYRTYQEQAALNSAGLFSAPAGSSNHESTAYPGGAVDVTQSSQLISVLVSYPGPEKLVGGVLGPVDPEHFSATGY